MQDACLGGLAPVMAAAPAGVASMEKYTCCLLPSTSTNRTSATKAEPLPVTVRSSGRNEPMVHIPDRDALTLYLRGRGLPAPHASTVTQHLNTPLDITKRGMIGWVRKAQDA